MKRNVLITGSCGLVGLEASRFFLNKGFHVIGIDNNRRKHFFGVDGDVFKNKIIDDNYTHADADIRDATIMEELFRHYKPVLVIHAAAQPSHDWAVVDPIEDFTINANGTLILLNNFRKYCPEAIFIYVSTNKVYGVNPNKIALRELPKRYEPYNLSGINENMLIDHTAHSLFGVSKLAGDMMAQEYGKYFNLNTGIFRCGCITGKAHAGVEQHGFLAYMAKCRKERRKYTIYGYKGKQVRDIIHAHDLARAFFYYFLNPRKGEVYNMGGGKNNNISVLEAIERFELRYTYLDRPRRADHIWYVSDVSKFMEHYPSWDYRYSLDDIIEEFMS